MGNEPDEEMGSSPVEPTTPVTTTPAELIKEIDINASLELGKKYFLLSEKWWSNFEQFCKHATKFDDTLHPGPIDNSSLWNESQTGLKQNLSERIHYVILTEEQWEKLISWFGALQSHGIKRTCVQIGSVKNLILEVYPKKIQLQYGNEKKDIYMSRAATVADLKKYVCEVFGVVDDENSRLKRKDSFEEKELNEPNLQLDLVLATYLSEKVILEVKENGKWPSAKPSSTYSSLETDSSFTKGATGLGNLGNTCFMNSGLQCLSNTRPLAQYFLEKQHLEELNRSNPLGMGGKIAEEFGTLLQGMWSGSNSSISPRELKMTIGRFAPQFSGYAQHDSQELLAFLLDGLHEDLNRIIKKPYIEIKDSNGRDDDVVAQESWEAHKKRNDSIISDLFLGQFKSRVTCPECSKVSVTFDPFLFLSLPLPAVDTRTINVTFASKDPSQKLQKVIVPVPKRGSASILKDQLAQVLQIPKEQLVTAEVYDHRFHTFFQAGQSLRDIKDTDIIFAYELSPPTSALVTIRVLVQTNTPISLGYRTSPTKNRGVPIVISVPEVLTYDELYEIIKFHLGRFGPKLHEETKSEKDQLEEGTEDPMEEDEKAEEELDRMLGEGEGEDENKKVEPPKKPRSYLFKLQSTQMYGYSAEDLETDPSKPLKLKNESFISAVWEKETFDLIFPDDFTQDVENHPSVTESEKSEQANLSVQSCLELFMKEERLGAENAWFCPQCKEDRQATKKFDIWRLPEILVIHLKRFSYTSYLRDKIDSYVDFPLTGLDLGNYLRHKEEGKSYVYDLYAVSNHFGGLGGGHYTAYAKNALNGNWYHFDDSSVKKVDPGNVKTAAAYVLCYQRRNDKKSSQSSSL